MLIYNNFMFSAALEKSCPTIVLRCRCLDCLMNFKARQRITVCSERSLGLGSCQEQEEMQLPNHHTEIQITPLITKDEKDLR